MSKKNLTQSEFAKKGGDALKKMKPKSYYSEISKKGLAVRLMNKRLRELGEKK